MKSASPPSDSTERLQRLFEAHSIAIVGASPHPGSFGRRMMSTVSGARFDGDVYLVNPRYGTIDGRPCFDSLHDCPQSPDLVLLGVGSARIEQAVRDCIATRAGGAVIFDDCMEAGDPLLLQRLKALAQEANFPICGGNCMGFFNITGQRFGSYYPASHLQPGGISLIAHSGSVFTVLAMSDARYRFDLLISPGQEISITLDEYVAYAVARPATRVIAIFMETARNPKAFVKALECARQAHIPVVACKVARTNESARMAFSHTGALAGSYEACAAACERHGAILVDTVDQLMNTALLCAQGRTPGGGGLAMITDSGGMRENTIDRADHLKLPLATMTPQLKQQLQNVLPPSLEPSNPLDCLSELSQGYENIFGNAIRVFDDSDDVAVIGFECDLRDDFIYAEELHQLVRQLPSLTSKPCFFYSSFSQANNRKIACQLADLNIPVINGLDEVLYAANRFIRWGSALTNQASHSPPPAIRQPTTDWRRHFATGKIWDEYASLALLRDFGITTASGKVCNNASELEAISPELDFPVALKTAQPGIHHKSDRQGVVLNVKSAADLQAAYQKMAQSTGPRVIVQSMVHQGVELAYGCVMDADFGPLVMVGSGGILVELIKDKHFFLPPVSAETALELIESLPLRPLLDGVRNSPPVDKKAAARALSIFSHLCVALQDCVQEIEINPLIVTADDAVAVDALIIPSGGK